MGIGADFDQFYTNLLVSNRADMTVRYRKITRRLNLDFWGFESEKAHSRYVGSYGRNTAIDGISDIDMRFQLPNSEYYKYNKYSGNGQSSLIQAVKSTINNTYGNTDLRGDGQIVHVTFTDGVVFEVLPVFIFEDKLSYTYPDTNNGGTWKVTKPLLEIEEIKGRNIECNNNLVALCRYMRAWKYEWSVSIKSFLIDTLAYQFINDWEYKTKSFSFHDWMVRDFFDYLANQDPNKQYWLAPGSSQYVYRDGAFEHLAKVCAYLAKQAIDLETDELKARKKWRDIFGNKYPIQ
jgi:hypothetical protein